MMSLKVLLVLVLGSSCRAMTALLAQGITHIITSPIAVSTGEVLELFDTQFLWAHKRVRNEGGIHIVAINDSFLNFDRFINLKHSWTRIEGCGVLIMNFRASLVNSKSSSFEVSTPGNLEIGIADSEHVFGNVGDMSFESSDSIILYGSRRFINRGRFSLSSSGNGFFTFSDITNVAVIEIQSSSNTDFLKFNELVNENKIYFQFGKGKGDVVYAEGAIDNFGAITISGLSGQGVFAQGDTINNCGLICLKYTSFEQTEAVIGRGCWILSEFANMVIDFSVQFDARQSIVFTHPTAYIAIDEMGTSLDALNIYGLINGSQFIMSSPEIISISYDPVTGLFKLNEFESTFIYLNVGPGYDPNAFDANDDEVIYEGHNPPPRSAPMHCNCEKEA